VYVDDKKCTVTMRLIQGLINLFLIQEMVDFLVDIWHEEGLYD
jgi:hypothetical protein